MKLNLGCGNYLLDGYTNIDAASTKADVRGDFMEMQFSNVDEIVMAHVLEHFSWRITGLVLSRCCGWLRAGGRLTVEVPDFPKLCRMVADGRLGGEMQQWVFGEQSHAGEFHAAGFSPVSLVDSMNRAGFSIVALREFSSSHSARVGYPCIEAVGVKL